MIKKLFIIGLLLLGLSSVYAQDASPPPKEPLQADPEQQDNLAGINSVLAVKIFVKNSDKDFYTVVVNITGKVSYSRTIADNDKQFKRETVESIKGLLSQEDLNSFLEVFNKLDFTLLKEKENAPEVEPESWIGIACVSLDEKSHAYRAETGKYAKEVKQDVEKVLKAVEILITKIK